MGNTDFHRHNMELGIKFADIYIPVSLLTVLCKVQIPLGDPLHSSVASGGEGSEKVESGGGLTVGPNHPFWIRNSGFLVESISVHIISSVTRQFHAVFLLERIRSRLRELARHSSHLHNNRS